MNAVHAHLRPRGEPAKDSLQPSAGILEEIDSAFIGLPALLRAAARQYEDFPGARRLLHDSADHIARAAAAFRSRLTTELPAALRPAPCRKDFAATANPTATNE